MESRKRWTAAEAAEIIMRTFETEEESSSSSDDDDNEPLIHFCNERSIIQRPNKSCLPNTDINETETAVGGDHQHDVIVDAPIVSSDVFVDDGALPSCSKDTAPPSKRKRITKKAKKVIASVNNNAANDTPIHGPFCKTKLMLQQDFKVRPKTTPRVIENLKSNSTPVFFELFTEDIQEHLVGVINEFAESKIAQNTPATKCLLYSSWKPINIYELLKLLAVLIAMRLGKKSLGL